ncbi:MAG: 3-methyl-2-oxobutanoate hydroxymethyltransferase [Desulfobacula sp.]|jgi:3-methyl-2-oxobutanoate hydroxymethyltransferase|uniref:3-methyl-2-oxobutanoate hydroxymethyltransferase n=1 Tax=Desulfobacula sp. TaxID=2593537 RepID=UPI001D6427F4|nr:3-methyl-2-oxobutanoate hydroxymethyltransferase [Desulfobacula sp.]MBT3483675.1 3-methyl-2-oxobutanoate hydroxymethyltransferase [Desulfobacula sp.]MBT3803551.1 3-methyl-2-oxobutanoate hydroxymethyltransferase [Desulfobacula sp.]MBT4023342.1 3-methyl-2-oxobutanoate hydroxymethyltransferase [Desulfobacula sp.]MBT4197327.1 3-methyl-2-oxobutanoate hydroxymethyltransferase [Desulfobacula sp.]
MGKKKLTRWDLQKMKESGEKAVWITAYDYWNASFAEKAGMDMILVGDSLGMCVYGYESTVPVTMEQCIYHSEAVRRAAKNTFIVGDMPFLSYQISIENAVLNAGRFHKEAAVDAIKLEGGKRVCPQIRAITDGGMLVMGHIGLTPQSSGQLGGFKAQGRTADAAFELIEDAKAIQKAGAFSVLVEAVPPEVCNIIRKTLTIPVYSIGAGIDADGQLMISSDVAGVFQAFTPKFVKKYENLADKTIKAFSDYRDDVKEGKFPALEHTYKMVDGELDKLITNLKKG